MQLKDVVDFENIPEQKCRGRVSMWNPDRGFGYLSEADLTKPGSFKSRTFFHVSQWAHDTVEPKVGQVVEYVLGHGKNPGQVQALNVILIRNVSARVVVTAKTAADALGEKTAKESL
jgi:cold shock CspA family protein